MAKISVSIPDELWEAWVKANPGVKKKSHLIQLALREHLHLIKAVRSY